MGLAVYLVICLAVNQDRWCKKTSRKGTVADRIITRDKIEIEKHKGTLDKVKIGDEELDNVYSVVSLGSENAADDAQLVAVNQRCDIAWGRFGEYKKVLLSTKLLSSSRQCCMVPAHGF